MSEHGSSASEGFNECKAQELTYLAAIPTLPWEIQANIVSQCDLVSLGILYRVNKAWHARTLPVLWHHLEFRLSFDQYDPRTPAFFATCDDLMNNNPERFAFLASHVRTLDVGRLYGINIVHHECEPDDFAYYDSTSPDTGGRSVFGVIARFTNLEALSLYVRSFWDYRGTYSVTGQRLADGLTKLTSLKLGGQMPPGVLTGLMKRAPQLKHLALINLHRTPGQDNGPDGMTVLSESVCSGFKNLETLHLCKLADLDGRESYDDDSDDSSEDDGSSQSPRFASGMRWEFPRGNEVQVLQAWTRLLRSTSSSLKSLTLENRYLCSYGWEDNSDEVIEPGNGYPADYGAFSIAQSQQMLFPELLKLEWPRLEELTLVGMGTPDAVNLAVAHFPETVAFEQRPGQFVVMRGDATPEELSTPAEFWPPEP